jgi:hypothetical protein
VNRQGFLELQTKSFYEIFTAVCIIDDSRRKNKQEQTFDPPSCQAQISFISAPIYMILGAFESS